jgi:hypothetical protein
MAPNNTGLGGRPAWREGAGACGKGCVSKAVNMRINAMHADLIRRHRKACGGGAYEQMCKGEAST